jgi:GT2 family glycosyltransferase
MTPLGTLDSDEATGVKMGHDLENLTASDISVDAIVPHYNEAPASLLVTLRGLSSQSFALNQVILVDDGSSAPPDLSTVLAGVKLSSTKLRLEPNAGISAARNFGARHSTAKYLLFVNAEIELTQNWVRNAVLFLEHNPIAGLACGQVQSRRHGLLTEWRRNYLDLRPETWIDKTHELEWAVGHAFLIAKAQLDGVGGWDERYRRAYEDIDLCKRLRANGKKIFQVQGAVSICHSRISLRELAAKQIRNRRWNLNPHYVGDPALRPLELSEATGDFYWHSKKRFEACRNAKRWDLVLVEVGVLLTAYYLFIESSLKRHVALKGSTPFSLWFAELPHRFRRKVGRFLHKLRSGRKTEDA